MKGTDWVVKKYWKTINGRKWTFTDGNKTLITHDKHKAGERYIKIKEDKSPFDGDEKYWQERLERKHRTQDTLKAKLIKNQQGKCPLCQMNFLEEDKLDIHHIQPKYMGGKDEIKNLMVVHKHCHIKTHQVKVVAQEKV
ncbi:MAG: HNH endonuclease [Crocosphaera sp.]